MSLRVVFHTKVFSEVDAIMDYYERVAGIQLAVVAPLEDRKKPGSEGVPAWRTSPVRPPSATAAVIVSLWTSSPM